MSRIGTCKDCGARFKVPETSSATRAKCAKCGGVVEIPAADESPGAPAPAAKAPVPAPKAPAAAKAPSATARPAGAAGGKAPVRAAPASARKAPVAAKSAAPKVEAAAAKSAGSSRRASAKSAGEGKAARGGSRRSGGSSRKSAKGGADGDAKKSAPVGLIVGIVVVVLGGSAAFYFMQGDDPASTTPAVTGSTEGTSESTSAPAGTTDDGSATKSDVEKAPAPADAEKAPAPAELEKAPAPSSTAVAKADVPSEPLPTLIEFDELPPVVGSTAEEVAAWTAVLSELYMEDGGAVGRTRKALQEKEAEFDAITAIPAYLNAINGVDFADTDAIKSAYSLIAHWQERVGGTPTFYFDGDISRMSVIDQNKRVIVVKGWVNWWTDDRKSGQDADLLEQYREKVAEKLAAKAKE